MATVKTIDVHCPRCGEAIQLSIEYGVKLIQSYPGRKAFITLETGASGVEHTCPETREY